MRNANALRLGVFVLTCLLLSAPPIAACFADEPEKSTAASSADGNPEGAKAPVGIDTRISVQPSRPKVGQDEIGKGNKIGLYSLGNLHPRPLSKGATSDRPLRDAIGVPVVPHGRDEQHDGEHFDFRPAPIPGTGLPGVTRGASDNVFAPKGRLDHPAIVRPNTNQIGASSAFNRGSINGTRLLRPGSAPAGIGGPAKTGGGISGTSIRPKQ